MDMKFKEAARFFTPCVTLSFSAVFNDGVEVAESSDPLNAQITPADGDVNTDGVVDITDLLVITKIALGLASASASEQLHGDVGPQIAGVPVPDGHINIADVLLVQRKLFGLVNF